MMMINLKVKMLTHERKSQLQFSYDTGTCNNIVCYKCTVFILRILVSIRTTCFNTRKVNILLYHKVYP